MTIIKKYELLLDDHDKDLEYTKGQKSGKYLVNGSALEIHSLLGNLLPVSVDGNTRHHNDCTVSFVTKKDKEIPNKPRCFGTIIIAGDKQKVLKVEELLSQSIKELTKLSQEIINN